MGSFGAPDALTAGTPEEIAFLGVPWMRCPCRARSRWSGLLGGGTRRGRTSTRLSYPPRAGARGGARWLFYANDPEERPGARGRAERKREARSAAWRPVTRQPLPAASRAVPFAGRPDRTDRALARIASLVLVSGAAGGAYLYFHESVAAVAAQTPEVKRAARALNTPLPGQPAVALVIGYDHRREDGANTSGRSDALMLVRADPSTDSISLLSFRATCGWRSGAGAHAILRQDRARLLRLGPQGSLDTVKALTGIPVNYLITVNFRGFRQIIDRLGGAWIDVDRRYFNDRGGPSGYAKINLRPGYQQLTGHQALDYVRYRHTDSDLYRVARQQQFVKAFKGQVQESFAPFALPRVVNAITNNVEVAQGGGSDVPGDILSYALFAYGLPRGRLPNKVEGLEGLPSATTGSENIERLIEHSTHPDVESSEKATAVALGESSKHACRLRATRHHRPQRERRLGLGIDCRVQLGERSTRSSLPNGLPANAPRYTTSGRRSTSHPAVAGPRGAERRESLRLVRGERACRARSRISPTARC